MLFPSTEFAIFFGCVWAVAWLLREANTARKSFLAFSSLLFYAAWDPYFVVMLLAVAVLGFLLNDALIVAFNANPLLNGLILAVLALGLLPDALLSLCMQVVG